MQVFVSLIALSVCHIHVYKRLLINYTLLYFLLQDQINSHTSYIDYPENGIQMV